MIGGGPDGGIWKTINGGKTWTKLTNGLPPGEVGRITLAVDPKKPGRVYALIDGEGRRRGGGRWRRRRRSADAPAAVSAGARRAGAAGQARPVLQAVRPRRACRGDRRQATAPARRATAASANPRRQPRLLSQRRRRRRTWTRMSTYRGGGPAYYSEIFVDPRQPDTIWSINTNMDWSRDGGRTWTPVGVERGGGALAVHVDHHEVVFDPTNKDHLIIGNDGGVYETYDLQALRNPGSRERRTWPMAVLREPADHAVLPRRLGNEQPFYTVCGGTQDNFSMCGPSRTSHTLGIRTSDWYIVLGGDGFQSRPRSRATRTSSTRRRRAAASRGSIAARAGRTGIRPSFANSPSRRDELGAATPAPAPPPAPVRLAPVRPAALAAPAAVAVDGAAAVAVAGIASTGTRRTPPARTRRRGCTGPATTCIAPTIAARRGRASARICQPQPERE